MRLPHSGSSTRRGRHGRRILTLVSAALIAALVGAGVFLLVRSRSPILPIVETTGSNDAIELWRSGDYGGVVSVTTQHLVQYPLDDISLTLRGFARFYLSMEAVESDGKQDLLVEAVQDLRRVLLLSSPAMEPQVHYVLGKAYHHRGEFFYDMAVRELERAREMGIEQLDLFEYLALAHTALDNSDQAIRYFQDAIRIGDEDVHRLRLADVFISRGRYEEAEALLEAVLETTDDVLLRQHGLLSLGESHRAQDRYDDALATYDALLQINPSSAEARYQLGETYLAMDRRDRARFEWREALRLNPNHIESFQRLQDY